MLKKIGIVLLLILVIAQFFGPDKNDGNLDTVNAFLAETNPPENVVEIMKTSCFDCHSSKTNYPWYNNVTPVNYWLDSHVKDGKKHLDSEKAKDESASLNVLHIDGEAAPLSPHKIIVVSSSREITSPNISIEKESSEITFKNGVWRN